MNVGADNAQRLARIAWPIHILLCVLAIAGCQATGSSHSAILNSSGEVQATAYTLLERDLMSFADRSTASVADACERLADNAKTSEARNAALERRSEYATGALANAVHSNS